MNLLSTEVASINTAKVGYIVSDFGFVFCFFVFLLSQCVK